MNTIREYISFNNLDSRLMNNRDLKNIYDILCSYFGVKVNGLDFDSNNVYSMSYNFEKNMIMINYDKLIDYCRRDNILLTNYMIIFCLIHEFIHILQVGYEFKDGIKDIYDLCFNYIKEQSDNKLVNIIKTVIYHRLHDYFAVEINANIEAYSYLINLVSDEYKDYFYRELYELLKKCYIEFDLKKMYIDEMHFDIDERVIDASIYERIKYGVYLDSEINLDDIKLEKLIGCKSFNK